MGKALERLTRSNDVDLVLRMRGMSSENRFARFSTARTSELGNAMYSAAFAIETTRSREFERQTRIRSVRQHPSAWQTQAVVPSALRRPEWMVQAQLRPSPIASRRALDAAQLVQQIWCRGLTQLRRRDQ
ncbi:uncharacterized protein UV8b_07033 [Ustilaginoidea virens]|uniref:Uncharacterized protein n=1 Tax=Ustilaginoidea virens TaxID=1159556 RepID=A0A8E5MKK7_USTVR|nr:uncharacterized protein UV8b_07033 [Ustilaginoidea virens]QUC22792.1 hypothetical protein UV8b_07033 [Ustilaginoidea virens]